MPEFPVLCNREEGFYTDFQLAMYQGAKTQVSQQKPEKICLRPYHLRSSTLMLRSEAYRQFLLFLEVFAILQVCVVRNVKFPGLERKQRKVQD